MATVNGLLPIAVSGFNEVTYVANNYENIFSNEFKI
jgi:hypothetical protein